MNSRIINVRIPSQNKTVSTPAFLSRFVFCLNHHGLCTNSVELNDTNNFISIEFSDYNKFIKWINGLHNKANENTYNFIKEHSSVAVTLPEYGASQLIATWRFHKSKARQLDNIVFKLLRS
jgi:hypothetical protein